MSKVWLFIVALVVLSDAAVSAEGLVYVDSLDFGGTHVFPIETWAQFYSSGVGGHTQLNLGLSQHEGVLFGLALEYAYGISKTIWVNTFHDASFTLGVGYRFAVGHRLSLEPEVGWGMMFHVVDGDVDRDGTSSVGLYYDQYARAVVRLVLSLGERISIAAGPRFSAFLENDAQGFLIGYQAGARVRL